MNMPDEEVARVSDEWKVLSMAHDTEYPSPKKRVDYYWRGLFDIKHSSGMPKYPFLTKVVKNALVLPHGNEDVERA